MKKLCSHQNYVFNYLSSSLTFIAHRAELLSGAAQLSFIKIIKALKPQYTL